MLLNNSSRFELRVALNRFQRYVLCYLCTGFVVFSPDYSLMSVCVQRDGIVSELERRVLNNNDNNNNIQRNVNKNTSAEKEVHTAPNKNKYHHNVKRMKNETHKKFAFKR